MCGIAGILGDMSEANRQALARMANAMAHRGPDADGFWHSPPDADGRGCMLAHRRLAILDLSPAGAQPMVDSAAGHAIVFNGEIYNFQTLRDRLIAEGEQFASSGDTAVMLRLLARHGTNAVGQLRGMFAFALWNPAQRRLLLARDALGIKQLYFIHNTSGVGSTFAFASEVRALLASGLLSERRLDPAASASVVWNGFVTGPTTAIRGVELLGAGELCEIDAAGVVMQRKRFWTMPPAADRSPATVDEVRQTLEESVRLHLLADVPLGIFLSGGVDSSAIANLARRVSSGPLHTFNLGFEEATHDESAHAAAVARAIGSTHHQVMLRQDDFVRSLDAAIESLDQPTFDGLNSYYISKAVREAGLVVALAGTGGDELFGGYGSFRDLPRLHAWADRTRFIPSGAKGLLATLAITPLNWRRGEIPPQTRWAKLAEMVGAGNDLIRLYQLAYALFLPRFQRQLLNADAGMAKLRDGLPASLHRQLEGEIAGRSTRAAISVLELRCFLGERLLRDTDAASMAVSLETRLPLVDQEVVACVNRLPDSLRFEPAGRKQLLRTVGLSGLDPALFERPKSGFVLPIEDWLREKLGNEIEATLRDRNSVERAGLCPDAVERLWRAYRAKAPGVYWSRVWAIYILIRWCRRHDVTI